MENKEIQLELIDESVKAKDQTDNQQTDNINLTKDDLAILASLIKFIKTLKTIRGYIYGILFALSMCMANILIKMSPNLDGSNHAMIRYTIQLFVMFYFINSNNLEYLGPKKQRSLLTFRGLIGCAAVIISFFSIRYLDVSDVETLTNSCVLITALVARLVLKEKLTVCHILALILNVIGVLFILRPTFLFGIEENVISALHLKNITTSNAHQHLNQTMLLHGKNSNRTLYGKHVQILDHSNREVTDTAIGIILVLVSATCMSMAQVSIRKLCLSKIHFSITSIYPAYVGIPSSILVTIILILTNSTHANFNEDAEVISMQVLYSIIAGVFGTLGIIFLNQALKYEDPTKIGMVKMIGVLFSFILQYIFLDIEVDVLGVLGAIFVISGVLFVMMIKLYEKNKSKLNSVDEKKASIFRRILFIKF